MAGDDTLMAYLVPRLTGGVEDAATEAMAYIMNKSDGAMRALNGLLREGGFGIEPIVRVRTQVTLDDGSIPDMAGYDKDGKTRLLVESKFWAAFQDDQVWRYVQHLDQPGPAALLVICPDVRRQTVWADVKRQMEEKCRLEGIEALSGVNRAEVAGTEKHLLLVSWVQLLQMMADRTDNADVRAEIRQLRGLTQRQDEEAFLPLHAADLSQEYGRRYQGYCRLVDAAVDAKGVPEKWLVPRTAVARRWGWGRWFHFSGVEAGLWFGVNHDLWAVHEDTPLWLGLYYDHWSKVNMDAVGRELGAQVVEADWFQWVPIRLRKGVEYDEVLDDVAAQLRSIGAIVSGVAAADAPPS